MTRAARVITPFGRGVWLLLSLAIILASCGGESSPTSPTATPAPTVTPPSPVTPPVATFAFIVEGQIVETVSKQPIANARLVFEDDMGTVTTTPTGTFRLESDKNPAYDPYRVTITADGYLTRETYVRWARTRTDATIDVIANRAPFSLGFFRQFAHNAYHVTTLYPIARWTTNPNFYINTQLPNGRQADAVEAMPIVHDWLSRGVAIWTGGRLTTGIIEVGTTSHAQQAGWINVTFSETDPQLCGLASLGTNPGQINFHHDYCACGSIKMAPATVMHELGHALGFFHVEDRDAVMYPQSPGTCRPSVPLPIELHHAAIVYSRPNGNDDVDRDPASPPGLLQPRTTALIQN